MKMHLECVPCFFHQALDAARVAGANRVQQKRVLMELGRMLSGFSFEASPPELSRNMYRMIMDVTGNDDPFKAIKEKSNRLAMSYYEEVKRITSESDSLLVAVELSILGNVIDYGLKKSLDVNAELGAIVGNKGAVDSAASRPIFHYREFERALDSAHILLYLADNAGETVFDRILIEEIKRYHPEKRIIYAVKERPIINDALMEDASRCGVGDVAELVSSGSDAPGTILRQASKEFLRIFEEADMIISKGQGNFETLSEEEGPIFYLFMAKCQVVANHLGCGLREAILLDNSRQRGNTS